MDSKVYYCIDYQKISRQKKTATIIDQIEWIDFTIISSFCLFPFIELHIAHCSLLIAHCFPTYQYGDA